MKKGYHAVFEKTMVEAIDYAHKNGFDFVQFDLGVPTFFLDTYSDDDLLRIYEYARERDTEITLHGPCDNVSLYCDYPMIRRGILDQYKTIMGKATILHARHITVHTGNYPSFKKSGNKEDDYLKLFSNHYKEILTENIREIGKENESILLCIENNDFSTFTMDAVDVVLEKGLAYLTVDIPKMYTRKLELNEDIYSFMKRHKEYIREAHIHDFSPEYGKHQEVGSGAIDFTAFKDLFLNENVYINFEVRPKEAAKRSMTKFADIMNG